MKTVRAIGLASALAMSAGGATASTTLNPGSPLAAAGGFVAIDINAPVTPAAADGSGRVYSGPFNVDKSVGGGFLETFVAWCMELTRPFLDGGDRTFTEGSVFPSTAGVAGSEADVSTRIQRLFDAAYDPGILNSTNQAAGFQLAIWELIYDTDADLQTSSFQALLGNNTNTNRTATINYAQDFLQQYSTTLNPTREWTITYYQGTDRQNIATVSPIPLPAAGWLLLAALTGLGVAARRKRKMAA
jgi:hypothetical protein